MKFANLDMFTWLSWFRSLNFLHDKIHDTTPFQFNLSLFMITNHSSYKIHTKFHITFFGSILYLQDVFFCFKFEPLKKKNGDSIPSRWRPWRNPWSLKRWSGKCPLRRRPRRRRPFPLRPRSTKIRRRGVTWCPNKGKREFFLLAMVEVDLCDDLCMFFVDWWWCVVPFVSICCMIWY